MKAESTAGASVRVSRRRCTEGCVVTPPDYVALQEGRAELSLLRCLMIASAMPSGDDAAASIVSTVSGQSS